MKKLLLSFFAGSLLILAACNNETKIADDLKVKADALEKEVLEGHDIAMPKSMKIPDIQKKAQALLDSIGKLPVKAQEAAAPLKTKLEEVKKDLSYAENAMDKWMTEYNFDSAKNNLEQRIKYLTDEKLKVDKVKEAVLGSLAKADSLLKAKI